MYKEAAFTHSENSQPLVVAGLEEKIHDRSASISIIGQGYVGLPLAVEFSRMQFRVTGLDSSQSRVDSLNSYHTGTPDVSDDDLRDLKEEGFYQASLDFSILRDSEIIIICVPTPLRKTKDPDISYIISAAERVRENLRPGQLIILESTTYPGTTEEILLPMLNETGLKAGRDYFLAFSPERIDPGNKKFPVRDIPKIVGGITPECTYLAAILYRQIVDKVVEVSSPKVAELAKLYENVFRSVNIALANEFSLICRQLGISTREVVDAAATKPFGFMPFYPGPGIGGHCIPVDPSYLTWKMRMNNYQTRFIPLAEEINLSMPAQVITLVTDALNTNGHCLKGARIHVLGVAYKADVGDTRESPALQIIELLRNKGAEISYADPFVPSINIKGNTLLAQSLSDEEIAAVNCVLILTAHSGFDYRKIVEYAQIVVDTRDATWNLDADLDKVIRL